MPISIRNLDFSYGRLHVLRDITASLLPGRITAIIGPNAAGKSTLLRCMIGALTPERGEIHLDGAPISSFTPRRRASRIAYVAQRSVVSASFTVRQVVELGRYALQYSAKCVNQAIDRLELSDISERPYPELSVGQQQRVTLARAVAQLSGDGILILDEPTSAMDLSHVSSSMRLLRELTGKGATIAVAMHDLTLAASIADDVWLLDQGRIAAQGPVSRVMNLEELRRVFKVPFEWVSISAGNTRLVARLFEDGPADRMVSP